jgi:signal transduction histidine kinase
MERIRRTFSVLADRKQIRFSVDVDASAPGRIRADADRLRDQVLGNLLSNAVKFTPEAGKVSMVILGDGKDVVMRVSDSGPGIPAEQLPHIFDKYYQVGAQARAKGAGLGLTIAHEVVDAHDGTIVPESQEGVGTTFTIRLPVDGPDTASAQEEPAAAGRLRRDNGDRGAPAGGAEGA